MKHLENVGNLKLYFEEWEADIFEDPAFTVYAVNGADVVGKETFQAIANAGTLRIAAERLLHRFDIYTDPAISAGLPEIISEYDGLLLSGKIAGFDTVEYFQRIDGTRFYKHMKDRPNMFPFSVHVYRMIDGSHTLM